MNMRNDQIILPSSSLHLLLVCVIAGALSSDYRSKAVTQPPTTPISFDKTAVKLGEEIRITPARVVQNWSGMATVNTFRARLPIDSKNNIVRVTRENGFTTLSPNEICVSLKDGQGNEIPVANECVRVDVSLPAFRLDPEIVATKIGRAHV